MFLNSIANESIEKVDHFLNDNITQLYKKVIEKNIADGVKQKYDQLNISDVEIQNNTDEFVEVKAFVRFLDYKIDRKNGKIVSGNNQIRTKRYITLKFKKNSVEKKIAFKCPNCGASLNINEKSFCNYCGKPVDERFSDLVLWETSF